MKKITLVTAIVAALTASSAFAVDISHDFSYGSTVATGNVKSWSNTHEDTQVITIASDADAGRDFGSNDVRIVTDPNTNVSHLHDSIIDTTVDTGVDNTVSGNSFETSFTHTTTKSRDAGTFSSITAFHENTITAGGLSAGEGGRFTTYSQDMTGSSNTKGYTDTVKVDVNTNTNGTTENGTEYKTVTSHIDFGSSVTDKVTTTRKNTITDYSFIK